MRWSSAITQHTPRVWIPLQRVEGVMLHRPHLLVHELPPGRQVLHCTRFPLHLHGDDIQGGVTDHGHGEFGSGRLEMDNARRWEVQHPAASGSLVEQMRENGHETRKRYSQPDAVLDGKQLMRRHAPNGVVGGGIVLVLGQVLDVPKVHQVVVPIWKEQVKRRGVHVGANDIVVLELHLSIESRRELVPTSREK